MTIGTTLLLFAASTFWAGYEKGRSVQWREDEKTFQKTLKDFGDMNTETGEIKDLSEVRKLPSSEQKKYIEMKRDLSLREKFDRQVALYAPCGCGSGKKFKFCCKV